jgi:hypothetical protein
MEEIKEVKHTFVETEEELAKHDDPESSKLREEVIAVLNRHRVKAVAFVFELESGRLGSVMNGNPSDVVSLLRMGMIAEQPFLPQVSEHKC